ncbi:phosphodiester glycosidase family protein [Flavobacterium sp. J27]|uniref:phosphodiester glycosidase family protein n=1 Tax=Flavobacterium sp. J27 TaxID=2060419 RepID=UPI00102FF05F|nr:phosphodiester glycosidase family protein [Flavobacterium sp. J27]
MKKPFLLLFLLLLFLSGFTLLKNTQKEERFVTYRVNPNKEEVIFYWKNEDNLNFGSINNLKKWLFTKNKELIFATNGGMYTKDFSPLGLFVENSKIKKPLDTTSGKGNFYLKPNGVFYLTKQNKAYIHTTESFNYSENIKYATQSGPMLVVNNQIHKAFNKESKNLNIRNGVGVLENGEIVFAMSKKEINFYDFASYFKQLGCKNALYLDGFVSRTYLPDKDWTQTDGNFGVIIAVSKNK